MLAIMRKSTRTYDKNWSSIGRPICQNRCQRDDLEILTSATSPRPRRLCPAYCCLLFPFSSSERLQAHARLSRSTSDPLASYAGVCLLWRPPAAPVAQIARHPSSAWQVKRSLRQSLHAVPVGRLPETIMDTIIKRISVSPRTLTSKRSNSCLIFHRYWAWNKVKKY